ncbi:MAG TPA: hypothetical protein PKH16_16140 [Aequorivita sp.]|nr:hypothetical protein [Aequorivita sp.]
MNIKSIISFCIGAVSGAALTSVFILIWETYTGNVSMIAIVAATMSAVGAFIYCQKEIGKAVTKAKKENFYILKKYKSYYELLCSWMVLRNKGRILSEYFMNRNLKNVAIFGLGKLGICLYEELKNSDINIKYAIDINAANFSYLELKVVSPETQLEAVDAIIVTPFFEYQKIVDELRKNTSYKIVNLEDVISSI